MSIERLRVNEEASSLNLYNRHDDAPSSRDIVRYVLPFVVISAIVTVTAFVGSTFSGALSCSSTGYRDGYYMAYCTSPAFGDYEHGALFYNLEPGIEKNLPQSELLFLGDSQAQTGFSGQGLRSLLDREKVKYYILGFGYGESEGFIVELLKRWAAHPKVIVINIDPFFHGYFSQVGMDVLSRRFAVRMHYTTLQMFERFQRSFCSSLPALCPDTWTAVYRSANDGHWEWSIAWAYPPLQVKIDPAKQNRIDDGSAAVYRAEALKFVEASGLRPECIVFTGVPNGNQDSPYMATKIGEGLGVRVITPKVDNLSTFDTAHLNFESADRWSAAFATELEPVIAHCIGSSH